MTSGQLYATLPGTIAPVHLGHDAPTCVEGSEWYAPPTPSYIYNDPYITPYTGPSSTIEGQPWTHQSTRASAPDIHLATSAYGIYPHVQAQAQCHQLMQDPGRPRSSPSTFGPSPETMEWTTTSTGLGLGIHGLPYTTADTQPTPPVTSTFAPNMLHTFPTEDHIYSTSSPPEIRQPQPRRAFTSIAPSPALDAGKRKRDDAELDVGSAGGGGKRRKRATSVASQADLSEDDRFLVQLKEDENLAWKDIAARFMHEKGKNFQVAALQMRYKRLREKLRPWDDDDVQALKLAHEYWEKYKWEIVSAKMLEYGIYDRWPARHCARKWADLEAASNTTAQVTALGMTPASLSSIPSPIEGPVHFAFMPMQ